MTRFTCSFKIVVPKNRYMLIKVQVFSKQCREFDLHVLYNLKLSLRYDTKNCRLRRPSIFLPPKNFVYFQLKHIVVNPHSLLQFKITFWSTRDPQQTKIEIIMTSPTSGFATLPGYNGINTYAPLMSASGTIQLPDKHILVISSERFLLQKYIYTLGTCFDQVSLYRLDKLAEGETHVWTLCGIRQISPEIYNQSL